MIRKRAITILATLLPWLVALGLAEVACRALLGDRLQSLAVLDERNLTYQHDPTLGWFPIPLSEHQFTGHRTISIRHNSKGFRDREHGPKTSPRIAFLGDSFVWGFDVEQAERFTEKLQSRIPNWEVLNWGVSGYGTDQEYLLLQRVFDEYRPDVVVLLFCGNDPDDNTANIRYQGYYKPYFDAGHGGLTLQGVPVPVSHNFHFVTFAPLYHSVLFWELSSLLERALAPKPIQVVPDPTGPLILAIRDFLAKKGVPFAIGFVERNNDIARLASESAIPFVDLMTPLRYPDHGGHWLPEGHDFVAQKLQAFLLEKGLLAPQP